MTFSVGHVEGGTGAGRKRPLRDKPKPWTCDCKTLSDDMLVTALEVAGLRMSAFDEPKEQPGYLSRCHVCKQERP